MATVEQCNIKRYPWALWYRNVRVLYKTVSNNLVYHSLINVAVVVEWLACLPVTQKIGVRFYLERESSATSRGWSIEGGTPGGLFRTRDGLPRIRKVRAARNVHECESVCAWNKNIVSAPKWLPCMNACMCAVFHYVYIYVFKLMCVFHCTALRALKM